MVILQLLRTNGLPVYCLLKLRRVTLLLLYISVELLLVLKVILSVALLDVFAIVDDI